MLEPVAHALSWSGVANFAVCVWHWHPVTHCRRTLLRRLKPQKPLWTQLMLLSSFPALLKLTVAVPPFAFAVEARVQLNTRAR